MGAKQKKNLFITESTLKELMAKPLARSRVDKAVSSHLVEILSSPTNLEEKAGDEEEGSFSGLTYGHTILTNVVFERYDSALSNLDDVVEIGNKYPKFAMASAGYIRHGKSLVRAIRSKRQIGKLPQISKSKQQELLSMLGKHFEDLKACVVNIEKIDRRARRNDLASTRIFVVSAYWSAVLVLLATFFNLDGFMYLQAVHQWLSTGVSDTIIAIVNWVWPG